jgi:hypothetical protein
MKTMQAVVNGNSIKNNLINKKYYRIVTKIVSHVPPYPNVPQNHDTTNDNLLNDFREQLQKIDCVSPAIKNG